MSDERAHPCWVLSPRLDPQRGADSQESGDVWAGVLVREGGGSGVTELEIPPDSDAETAEALVREVVDVGAVVRAHTRETMGQPDEGSTGIEGRITGFEPGYLELDGEDETGKSVRWDELSMLTRLES